ncbi:Oxalate decarboxylase OxdC [Tolypocladium paradoxum]|uniref:Oxalate decarboxylase OxdC n=1 Tax=Tolypocladium paradoxum TaxID=94208 RepID=A0A2S4L6U3_9HYPO|nr:Oxalate decarboxylase OxdC [Tolypocladium paradoxum]
MLEIFRSDQFRDFSLFQWMGETPQRMVLDHLFALVREALPAFPVSPFPGLEAHAAVNSRWIHEPIIFFPFVAVMQGVV